MTPAMLYICNGNNTDDKEYMSGYNNVETDNYQIKATATITTDNGSVFLYEDVYTVDTEGLLVMDRNVMVQKANSGDVGFATRYGLVSATTSNMTDYDMFGPGVWYCQNENVVDGAFASDYDSYEHFFIKENRLTLPMFAMMEKNSGNTLSICHKDAVLSTEQSEITGDWLVDEGFQFGSIGIKKSPSPSLYYTYPCYEGDKNYYGHAGMVKRSHPVQTEGIAHKYSLYISLSDYGDFSDMLGSEWQKYFNKSNPEVTSVNQELLYENALDVFDKYYRDDFGGPGAGLPWSEWTLKEGCRDYHLQSGFVGQQAKVGWLLFQDGLKKNNTDRIYKGMKIIDFWVDYSMTECGLPRTDYFCEWNNGQGGFLANEIFLRTASDACEGVLEAYNTGVEYGTIKSTWLDYCKQYADFLVNNQRADGTWARCYNDDGSEKNSASFNTTNAIRFLVRLYSTTGEEKYKNNYKD